MNEFINLGVRLWPTLSAIGRRAETITKVSLCRSQFTNDRLVCTLHVTPTSLHIPQFYRPQGFPLSRADPMPASERYCPLPCAIIFPNDHFSSPFPTKWNGT